MFSNHYHFVAHSPAEAPDASSLGTMLSVLHVKTDRWVNKLDGILQRQVVLLFQRGRLGGFQVVAEDGHHFRSGLGKRLGVRDSGPFGDDGSLNTGKLAEG